MSGSGQALNAVKAKFDQLKKAWESKKLDDAGKLLLDLKIGLTMLSDGDKPMDERVSLTDYIEKYNIMIKFGSFRVTASDF